MSEIPPWSLEQVLIPIPLSGMDWSQQLSRGSSVLATTVPGWERGKGWEGARIWVGEHGRGQGTGDRPALLLLSLLEQSHGSQGLVVPSWRPHCWHGVLVVSQGICLVGQQAQGAEGC